MRIEIKETSYPLQFGYGAIRILGDAWELKGPQQVFERFGQLFDGKEAGSFEQMDAMALLVCAGIENAKEQPPALYDVVDEIMANPDLLSGVMEAFQKSIPQGNPQPAPKGRKKKG